jgi:MoaA/NifB/PqqE/SkfB family radical SAM enzyme
MEAEKNMKPLLLHYFVTNRCNARCSFCEIWREMPKCDAEPSVVLRNLGIARKAGCTFVDFTGGEPLFHPDLPLFLREAKKLGFITSVTTNCILFEQRARDLAGIIDLLHFSLDADNAELHNRIRGCDSYDAVIKSIPVAIGNGMAPDLLFTYTNENIDAFAGVYALARKNKLMAILDPVFSVDGEDIASRETHRKALDWSRKRGVYLNKAHLALRFEGGNGARKNYCKAVSSTLVVVPDGSLALPCFHHASDVTFSKLPLDQALQSRCRAEALQLQGTYPFCAGCHINCYFDPSFTSSMNKFAVRSLAAKVSYAITKYLVYRRKASPFSFFTRKKD